MAGFWSIDRCARSVQLILLYAIDSSNTSLGQKADPIGAGLENIRRQPTGVGHLSMQMLHKEEQITTYIPGVQVNSGRNLGVICYLVYMQNLHNYILLLDWFELLGPNEI